MTARRLQELEALGAARELLAAHTVHQLGLVVLTEPSGRRCMELRRFVEGRPLVFRLPYHLPTLAWAEVEGVEIEYRPCVRLPKDGAP